MIKLNFKNLLGVVVVIMFVMFSFMLTMLAAVVSTAPLANNITITNNKITMDDSVAVTGLAEGDVVRVYSASTGTTVLGTGTVATGQTSVTITIAQIASSVTATGPVYISVQSTGKDESTRTSKTFTAERSTAPSSAAITISNEETGEADTVTVSGLVYGAVVNVYNVSTGGTAETVTVANGATTATVSKVDLLTATGGTAYVTITNPNKSESARTSKVYSTQPVSTVPLATSITVVNNKATVADTVYVSGLTAGDVVNIYSASTGGTLIGTVDALVGLETTAVFSKVDGLIATGGTIYVSVTSTATKKLESRRTSKTYTSQKTTAPSTTVITVTNEETGEADTVKVTGQTAGAIVSVYTTSTGGTAVTATVANGATEATVSSIDLLTATGGTIYVTITNPNKEESTRTSKTYSTQPVSTAPLATSITVVNNKATVADTVYVSGLIAGDIVNIYSAATGGTLIGTIDALVGEETTAVFSKVDGLTANGGTIYVTVTSTATKKLESKRTSKTYTSQTTTAPSSANITVTNEETGEADTVRVTGQVAGAIVSVYKTSTGGTAETATVANGATEATVSSVDLLTATGGTIYVTITNPNKEESRRISKIYATQPVSTAPLATSITIENNKATVADTVYVSGLVAGDVVNIYSAATGGILIGTVDALVGEETTAVFSKVDGLTANGGTIYVTVTSTATKKLESKRTSKTYISQITKAPSAAAITVTNEETGEADTVRVTQLVAGAIVSVYKTSTGGTAETATVANGATEATVSSIDLLTATGGTIYVTITNPNKAESTRTSKTYLTQPVSTAPLATSITIENNKATVADTVYVSGLIAGDIVNIYSAATGGTLIGTVDALVGEETTAVFSKVDGLIANGGTIYVSVTSTATKKLESKRTSKTYISQTTAVPLATNIAVLNNDGVADIVRVRGLAAGYTVNIYSAASGGSLLGTGTVAEGKTAVNININQLGTTAGKVYVTITKSGKSESNRVAKDYIAE